MRRSPPRAMSSFGPVASTAVAVTHSSNAVPVISEEQITSLPNHASWGAFRPMRESDTTHQLATATPLLASRPHPSFGRRGMAPRAATISAFSRNVNDAPHCVQQ